MTKASRGKIFDPLPRNMDRKAFQQKFGGVYEHFPAIAQNAWARGLTAETDTPTGLAAAMAAVAASMPDSSKLTLICNHPDLAEKTAIGGLTAASRGEQAGAGLDQCSPGEYRRFQELNDAYKEKFGFPFILAVGGKTRREIFAVFEGRIDNDRDTEFRTALQQIDRIAVLRLEKLAGAEATSPRPFPRARP